MEKENLQDLIIQQLRFHRISGLEEEECSLNIMSLMSQDWSSSCTCHPDDTGGETWCCSNCDNPSASAESNELRFELNLANIYIEDLKEQLASKDVRIKELEDALDRADK